MRVFTMFAMAAALTWPAFAQAESHPMIDSPFSVKAGYFSAHRSLKLRVDGAAPLPNDEFEFGEAFKKKSRDDSFAGEIRWQFGERWSVSAQHFRVSADAGTTLERDITWEDVVYPAGVAIEAGTRATITRIFLGRDFRKDEHHVFGLGIGAHQLEISGFIEGEAFVSGNSVGDRRETAKVSGPLPNIGGWYIWAPTDKWAFSGRLDWMSAAVDPYDGTIVNASIGVNYRLAQNFGVGLNYNHFLLNAGINDTDWRGDADLQYDGPYLYVSAYW